MKTVYGCCMGAVKTGVTSDVTIELPCVKQRSNYTCGAAALLAICRYYGTGPDDEVAIVRDMQLPLDGADPVHLVRAIDAYGLSYEETRGMTDDALRATLDAERPVMLALQAWGEGHWVVAIGYDKRGVLLEDPWLDDARGFLGWRALANRWHDVEGHPPRPLVRYGITVWGATPRRSAAARRAGPRSARSLR